MRQFKLLVLSLLCITAAGGAALKAAGAGVTFSANYSQSNGNYTQGSYTDVAINSQNGTVTTNAQQGIIDNQTGTAWNNQDSSSFSTGNLSFNFGGNKDNEDPQQRKSNVDSDQINNSSNNNAGTNIIAGISNTVSDYTSELGNTLFGNSNQNLADAFNAFGESAYSQTMNQLLYADASELGSQTWKNGLLSGTQALGANYIAHGPTESIWDNPYLEYTLKPLTHGATQGAIGQAFGEDFNAGFNAAVASSLTGALTRDIGYELGLNKEQRKEAAEQLASNIGQATAGLSGADPNFGRQIGENVYEYNDSLAKERVGSGRAGNATTNINWQIDAQGIYRVSNTDITIGKADPENPDYFTPSPEIIAALGYDPGSINIDAMSDFINNFNGVVGFMDGWSEQDQNNIIAYSVHLVASGISITEPDRAARLWETAQQDAILTGKATINATGKSIVGFVSIGLADTSDMNIIPVTEEDLARGYAIAESAAGVVTEVALTAAGGAALKAAGTGVNVTKAITAYDIAGNTVMSTQAGVDMVENGVDAQNALQLLAGIGGTGTAIYSNKSVLNASDIELLSLQSNAPNNGLGNSTTSPWLLDKRAGVRSHIESFRDGGSYLVPEGAYNNFIKGQKVIGRFDGQFITTKAAMDKILLEAGGDVSKINQFLGVNWSGKLYRIDIDSPLLYNTRLPSGLEVGADINLFRWGGSTSGAIPEAIVDQIPAGAFRATEL